MPEEETPAGEAQAKKASMRASQGATKPNWDEAVRASKADEDALEVAFATEATEPAGKKEKKGKKGKAAKGKKAKKGAPEQHSIAEQGDVAKKMSVLEMSSRMSLRRSVLSVGRRRSKSKSNMSFEEYSTSSSEEEIADKSHKKEKKAKAKPKKKEKVKKGKEKEDAKEEAEQVPEQVAEKPADAGDDVMAEIMRMKAAAEAGEEAVAKEEEEPKKKEKKKQKKKKKQKQITPEMLEMLRIEAEQEALRQAELERRRLEAERLANIEKEKREISEQRLRVEQHMRSYARLVDLQRKNRESNARAREQAEWEFYIACGRLPNPSITAQMNTYLHLWERDLYQTTMKEASQRTDDTVKLLQDLQDLLDTSVEEEERVIENWKWIRQLFRDHQWENLEMVTYKLLRNVLENLNRIDIPTADYNFTDENISFALWLRVQLPIPLPNPRRPPKSRIEVDFENVKIQVLFPLTVDCDCMAIRAMYLKYDHLSDLCDTFYMGEVPDEHNMNLHDSSIREWRFKLKYKYEHRDKSKDPKVEEGEGEGEASEQPAREFSSDEDIPIVPYRKLEPTASQLAIQIEDKFYDSMKKQLKITVPDQVINLRKFSVLGGVFCLNLVYQPPQPQRFVTMDLKMTRLFLPKNLEHVDYSVKYTPPPQHPPGTIRQPEEIEEDLKRQEEELDKLMLITVTWPSHVIFLELPMVCRWDDSEEEWTKEDVYDLKHNEESAVLTFRTGTFGTFALATIRYVNLPYQAWELKPEEDGSVTFQITASILMLEFNVKNGLICLSQLQNSPNKALTDIIGQYFKLYKLKRKLMEAGIDIFPEQDAFCYVEGACEKHWPMERHLYLHIAQMSSCFTFAWSRWNHAAGRRSIVIQMKEVKQKNHSMLLVTPEKASFVDCTEVSQVFCDEEIEAIKYNSDLYNVIKAVYSITIRKKAQNAPWEDVYALYELLLATRVTSFS